ncbi:LOW QUALITY PROTEIN: hypothetical protein GQ55_2G453300 [Panicum hallii var. hallii]|uniref:Alpha/beta hydrolase fold-3 domain-containing protein n=1 Tax=Panicum hallii var. hallii TaxID=1504633 RepID=A0A2T7EZB0_9POAL|nr:LOW QUALITY PROTEIN: hypothetical protein GQ55_2G453300 [Panicum hallii var. hallii]
MAGSDDCARRMPSLPWTVSIQAAAYAFAHRMDGSIRRPLFCLGDLKKGATPTPRPDASEVRSADVTIDASRGVWARVFSPPAAAAAAPLPVVVYFHGGGFALFSAGSRPYDNLWRRLCRGVGAVVVSVNYRLVPEQRFPAAYDDGVAALRYLDGIALPGGLAPVPVDLSSCFLAGDSSGGNMVHHVAQRWASMSATPSSPPPRLRLAGAVLIQPFFGGEDRTPAEMAFDKACRILTVARADRYWREFLPKGATRDHPRACGDGVELAEAFPPAMVAVGGFDLLKDWHARYVETLRRKGKAVRVVEYPDAFHGFYAFPELADSGKFVEDMKLFVDEHRPKLLI